MGARRSARFQLFWSLQAPLGHPGEQSRPLQAHEFRGAVGSADLPISRFQRMEEIVTFEAF